MNLIEKYPRLFPKDENGNPIGPNCGAHFGQGWDDLVSTLCNKINSHLEYQEKYKDNKLTFQIQQIKEKFGTLRFYYSGGDDYIAGMVSFAESMSGKICEVTGDKGVLYENGWVKTLSPKLVEMDDSYKMFKVYES